MGQVRIAVVEDDAMVRAALVERLSGAAQFDVVLDVATCGAYLRKLDTTEFDVLITDLGLPDGDGRSLIVATRARRPKVEIMVFTVFGDERRVVDAIRSGATGYLLKDDSLVEMTEAIVALVDGQAPISPGIARYLVQALRGPDETLHEALTPRELDVLRLAAKGFANREIAELLDISPHTVASYTKQLYEKLAVGSRNEAVYEATRLGILR